MGLLYSIPRPRLRNGSHNLNMVDLCSGNVTLLCCLVSRGLKNRKIQEQSLSLVNVAKFCRARPDLDQDWQDLAELESWSHRLARLINMHETSIHLDFIWIFLEIVARLDILYWRFFF